MRALGYVATSATTEVAINGTTYAEQTSGAQRSLKSSSASDAAAGTGARTVKITYFTLAADGTIAGPFTETVTLNGTTAVPTVATNIALIDKLEVITAGSGGVPAGAITLYAANDGTGTAIAAIATGDRRTYLAHLYVPSGQRRQINDLLLTSSEAATVQTAFELRSHQYGVTGAADQPLTGKMLVQGLATSAVLLLSTPRALVSGPARVQAYVTPGAATGTTQRVEFGYAVG